MNRNQSLYYIGWTAMIVFYTASFITGELWYLLGSSLCISIFGIDRASKKRDGITSMPMRWQVAMAMYLLVLVFYLWLNLDFVKNANSMLLLGLFLFPFLPWVIYSEKNK